MVSSPDYSEPATIDCPQSAGVAIQAIDRKDSLHRTRIGAHVATSALATIVSVEYVVAPPNFEKKKVVKTKASIDRQAPRGSISSISAGSSGALLRATNVMSANTMSICFASSS